ncbi:alpha/beta hydrolase family esterase [Corynebacterium phocae]|uniref:alpha/beta hydrolase family esterase n=1 Tax=Corynebacterium phocae TaxID=161895 RepID=UPI00095174E3|nr:PHB depolymerase family esterase [Corynebacterium phocae]KAA8725930.1 hypothetical protein F4V58_03290 [Corynebacterium phocae]
MYFKTLATAAVLSAALAFSSTASTPEAAAQSANLGQLSSAAGIFNAPAPTKIDYQLGTRAYTAYIPGNYNPSTAYPVIFAYGGYEHSAEKAASYMKLATTAGGHAIVIYPLPLQNHLGNYGWEGPSYAPTRRGEDVTFTRNILEDVAGRYHVDRARIYAAGLSNGGAMAMSNACQSPDIFAAVAGVATASYEAVFRGCTSRVPTLLIHGTDDPIINYRTSGMGRGGRFINTRATWAMLGQRNGCDTSAANITYTPGDGYDTFVYRGCTETRLIRVSGGGHTWFPGRPNTSQTVWDFFQRHHH